MVPRCGAAYQEDILPNVSPDRILRVLDERRDLVGDYELATSFRFGGIPFEAAEEGIKLYIKEVLPVIKQWKMDDELSATRIAAE